MEEGEGHDEAGRRETERRRESRVGPSVGREELADDQRSENQYRIISKLEMNYIFLAFR